MFLLNKVALTSDSAPPSVKLEQLVNLTSRVAEAVVAANINETSIVLVGKGAVIEYFFIPQAYVEHQCIRKEESHHPYLCGVYRLLGKNHCFDFLKIK